MRVSIALAFTVTVFPAISKAANNTTFIASLASALAAAGLTDLAATTTKQLNATSQGHDIISLLSAGEYTLLAPNNNAFKGLSNATLSNATAFTALLSYHILPGNISSGSGASTVNTVARTLLNASNEVHLEGNKTQAIAWKSANGTQTIINQSNITIASSTSFDNLTIHVVDGVLRVPGNVTTEFNNNGLSGVLALVNGLPDFSEMLTSANGVTFFAPSNDAISKANSSLSSIASNQSLLTTVLQNHVINGTSAYSPLLLSNNYTSAAGEPITTFTNSSGTFVTSGATSAQIIWTDVITENGVVHIIDRILSETTSDTAAASSAFQSATSAAAIASTQTAAFTTPSAAATGSSSGSSSGATAIRPDLSIAVGFALVFGAASAAL